MSGDDDPFAGFAADDLWALREAYNSVRELRRKIADLATVIEMDHRLSMGSQVPALNEIAARAAHARAGARHLEEMADQFERIYEICRRYQE